jgi:hypothetical protein
MSGDGGGRYHPLAVEVARRRREDLVALVQEAIRRLVAGEGNRLVPKSLPPGTIIDRGDWSATANYRPGDLVFSGGAAYVATAASTNQMPPNTAYWRPLGGTIVPPPPDTFVYLVDADGAYLTDSDGAYLWEPA